MSAPSVAQAPLLGEQLAAAVKRHRPAGVAVIGCAGGNGLELLDPTQVERVAAVDINPRYLEVLRARHARRFARLDLYCEDVQSATLDFGPVELIFAALLFEYVQVPAALATMRRNCPPGGVLVAVLQLPADGQPLVSASAFRSLEALAPVMRLMDPAEFSRHAQAAGFTLQDSTTQVLESGKRFEVMSFRG